MTISTDRRISETDPEIGQIATTPHFGLPCAAARFSMLERDPERRADVRKGAMAVVPV
jgi:hypothetical protein